MRESHETELRGKVKELSNLQEEIALYKRRLSESNSKIDAAYQRQRDSEKVKENEIRKKLEEWNEVKLKIERNV